MKGNDTGNTAASEAQRMMDAFTSVGADRFHVTFTNLREEETGFFKNRTDALQPARMGRAGRDAVAHLPSGHERRVRRNHACR